MKTITKRFLKGALAMLLVVVMLFGTTLTGFAAVVDNAKTSANLGVAETGLTIPSGSGTLIVFKNTLNWSNVHLYTRSKDLWNGDNGCTTKDATHYTMTNISGTDYWYAYMNPSYKYVLFMKDRQDGYDNIWQTAASYRSDFNSSKPYFTPSTTSNQSTNSTTYYSNGTWSDTADDDTTTSEETLIVFENTLGWSNVYLFASSSSLWNGDNGCTTNGATYYEMQQIPGTNKWYTYVNSAHKNVIFMRDEQKNYGNIWKTEASYRTDYNPDEPLFTPSTTSNETRNETKYFSSGSWSAYSLVTDFTVKFVVDGKEVHSETVASGEKPTYNTDPTKTGHTFTGWKSSVDEKTYKTSELPAITEDTTFTATYTVNEYDITFNYKTADGTSSSKTVKTAYGSTPAFGETIPCPNGYHFKNWTPAIANVTGNAEYTAVYEINSYNITFVDWNDSVINSVSATHGSRPNAPSDPTRIGYTFSGWTPEIVDAEVDATYKATYMPIQYTITLDPNGGEVDNTEIYYNIETDSFTLPIPTREGYAFKGWKDEDGNVSKSVTISKGTYGNKTYIAQWNIKYTVTVVVPAEGVTSVQPAKTTAVTVTTDFPCELGTKTDFTVVYDEANYRLMGWTIENADGVTTLGAVKKTEEITITSDTTVTPIVEKLYKATAKVFTNKVDVTVHNGAFGGTVTIENATSIVGDDVIFTATPANNYVFYGWFLASDTEYNDCLGTDTTCTVKQIKDGVELVAMFYKNFSLKGSYTGTFEYDFASNEYSLQSNVYSSTAFSVVTDSGANEVEIGTPNGGEFKGSKTSLVFEIDEDYEAPIMFTLTSDNGGSTYALNVEATLKYRKNVYCVKDETSTLIGAFSVGRAATFDIPTDDGFYVASVSVTTDPESAPINCEITNGTQCTIAEMPDADVYITPVYKEYRHIIFEPSDVLKFSDNKKDNYEQGENNVSFTVQPINGKVSISALVVADVDKDIVTIVDNGDSTYTVNVLYIPADRDIEIAVEYEGSYTVKCEAIYIDSFEDTKEENCVIEKKVNGTVVTDEYAPIGSTVEFTAKADKAGNATYTFVGFSESSEGFNGATSRSTASTYTMKAESDKTIYAYFVRDIYVVGEIARGWEKLAPMTYNVDTGNYTYTADTAYGDFVITPIANVDSSSLKDAGSDMSIGTKTGVAFTKTDAICKFNGLNTNYTLPITVTYHPDTMKIDAEAKTIASTIYLSSGRLDYDKGGSSAFSVASNFIDYEGSYTVSDPATHNSETYVTANISEETKFVRVQTTISGSMSEYYDVEYYYVYDATNKISTGIKANPLGNSVYEATVPVTSDKMYIVPLYFANEAYVAKFGGTRLKIVVDISSIVNDSEHVWGDFVSCYPFGRKLNDEGALTGDNYGLTGAWPGQLMIPVEKNVFETSVVVDGTTAERLTGVVFNNYMTNSLVSDNSGIKDELGITYGFVQTYDYNDALRIKESGYDLITFKPKNGTDGVNHKEKRNNTIDFTKFEELKDRSGNYPMDLTGQSVTNANATVGYYVRCVGNMDYQTMADNIKIDNLATGQWSVEWDIYDATTKNKLGTVMSSSMYHTLKDTTTNTTTTKLASILGVDKEDLVGKKVMISYELQTGDYHRTDGQWYGQKRDETKYKVDVKVAHFDESLTDPIVLNPDTNKPNVADYGTAYVISEGQEEQSAEFTPSGTSELTVVELKKIEASGYKFKGWYRYRNGVFEETTDFGISQDTTFVAVFEPLESGTLNITHAVYTNKSDYEILSNDGTAIRSVEIFEYDKASKQVGISLGSQSSLNGGTVSTSYEENKSYLIRLTAEPLGADTFNAWYMSATRADGSSTFEEVLTNEDDSKKDVVVAEFVYTYTEGMPEHITIYSDIKKVSVEARFIYLYKNRYGNDCFITKAFDMTTQEIDGFSGNNDTPRCPAHLDYTAYKDSKGTIFKAYTEPEKALYESLNYTYFGTSNQLLDRVPNFEVTQAVNMDISWYEKYEIDPKDTQTIRIYASKKDVEYTVTAYIDGVPDTRTGVFNTLIEPSITAPLENSNKQKFSYWQSYDGVDEEGNKINVQLVSYSPYYNYRIIEDKTIEAVYGADVEKWTPTIEEVTYTREYSDTGDYVYTDYLISYNSSNDLKIEELKTAGANIKYGLLLVRDPEVTVTKDNLDSFTCPTYSGIEEDLKSVAKGTSNTRIYDETDRDAEGNAKEYHAYYYNYTENVVTNFNRLIRAIKYDNKNTKNYKSYAFSAYAYFVDTDGEVYLSKPESVNFFELGSKPVEQLNN